MTTSSHEGSPRSRAGKWIPKTFSNVTPPRSTRGRSRDDRRFARDDVLTVSRSRRFGHLRRPVDADDAAGAEPLADKRDRDAVAAAELQSVVGLDVEAPDRPREALRRLAHAALA